MVAQPTILKRVLDAQQFEDKAKSYLPLIFDDVTLKGWTFNSDQGLKFRKRLFVPTNCLENVLKNIHHSRVVGHPRSTKDVS